jgi:hypothetical protein
MAARPGSDSRVPGKRIARSRIASSCGCLSTRIGHTASLSLSLDVDMVTQPARNSRSVLSSDVGQGRPFESTAGEAGTTPRGSRPAASAESRDTDRTSRLEPASRRAGHACPTACTLAELRGGAQQTPPTRDPQWYGSPVRTSPINPEAVLEHASDPGHLVAPPRRRVVVRPPLRAVLPLPIPRVGGLPRA